MIDLAHDTLMDEEAETCRLVLVALILLGMKARVHTVEQQRETRRRLSDVVVVVEPPTAEAEQDGLSAQQLQAAVER